MGGREPGGAMSRVMAVATVVAALVVAGAASAEEKIVLQLHGPAQFEFAGYYAALWQGYYRDARLTVEIKPGTARGLPATDPIREVTQGRAPFRPRRAPLVGGAAHGVPPLFLAPVL